jgi:hypothetical protein
MEFKRENFKKLNRKVGCYLIYTKTDEIIYPNRDSRLVYIGVSKTSSNGMKQRLESHLAGGNRGICNYSKQKGLLFTYQEADWLTEIIERPAADLERYLILDFAEKYGCYPICNARSEGELQKDKIDLEIDWARFEYNRGGETCRKT